MSAPKKTTCTADNATNGGAVTPLWLVALLCVAFYCGLIYLDQHSGDFQAHVYAPFHNVEEVTSYQPMEKVDPLYKRGEALYGMVCAVCHQASGVGQPGQCPPLAGSDWVLAKDPSRIIRLPLLGAGGPIKVSGVEYTPSVVMPPLASALPADEDLAAVITYVRQTWGNKASSVTVEQVQKVKKAMGDRKEPWTEAELLKVPLAE